MLTEVDENSIAVGNYVLCLDLKKYSDIGKRISKLVKQKETVIYPVRRGQTFAVIKLSRNLPYIYTLFKNGHVNVTGIRNTDHFKPLIYALLSKLDLLSEIAKVTSSAKIQNISATARIRLKKGECVNLRQLCENSRQPAHATYLVHARFDISRFPACNIKIKNRGSLLVFSSGKVVIVGCKNEQSVRHLALDILPNLLNYSTSCSIAKL